MSRYIKNRIHSHYKKLLDINKAYKNNLIIGDFNIDINSNEVIDQEFLQTLLKKGYYPDFKEVTRPAISDCSKGTCIDNLYIKLNKIKYKTFTLTTPFNDHYPIFMSMKSIQKDNYNNTYKYINYKKLKKAASTENWSEIYNTNDPNLATEKLIQKIKNCINKAETTKNKNKKGNMIPRKNWITSAIMTSCNKKEKLYKTWQKDPENSIKRSNYQNYAKTLNQIINKAKEDYDKMQIRANQDNPKKLWLLINNKLGKNIKKKEDISYINHNNNQITDPNLVAEFMNDFFTNVGTKLSGKITTPQYENIKLPPLNEKSIFIQPTTRNEIKKIIRKPLPPLSTSQAIDGWTAASHPNCFVTTVAGEAPT